MNDFSKEAAHCPVRIVPPYPNTYRFKVKAEHAGTTLLRFLTDRFPFRNQQGWEAKIGQGLVGVNGEEVAPDYTLSFRDEVFHHNPRVKEPAVPNNVRVLRQTDDYLFVYKPAPLPMHPGGRYNRNSLTAILFEQGFDDLRIVHRLDAVTSGIVLFARNKAFATKAIQCFSESKVEKTYYAVVAGAPEEDSVTIETSIRRKHGFVFECHPELENGKRAVTHFEVMERRDDDTSLIKCRPKTGRTHQIRLHLEHWGFPIVDDPIYGPNGDKSSRKAQKTHISLLNAGLVIEGLGVECVLKESEFKTQHSVII
ncbi:pseudouridine synthase family protein [Gracilimonas mengyeensis]|uniref:Pseudouridine synthase, RluA family n=1 Tax=Gracilimonas mengyeensis TaxID=1302730 RepID=A0A521DDV3_9BACT|nr:RluA family pseudouridine synthase [Gracilimonas mengyeensis]SMO69772.1 pseudouridine synthase, RluA family [Gracilimonas mengyeensis]